MMTLWGSGPPDGGGRSEGSSHGGRDYDMWDAAYVLGSLTSVERREFEAHMQVCSSCRSAVAELSGMPALLSQIDGDELTGVQDGRSEPPLPPNLLPSLLTQVSSRRRRTRLMTYAVSAAAAAVLAITVVVGVHSQQSTSVALPPQAAVPTQSMDQVGTTALASTFSVTTEHWGTAIDMKCVCLAPITAHHDQLAMVVLGRDGSRTRLATWMAEPGHTAKPTGSTAMPVGQIAAVQIVLADNDKVLLQRSL
jgi:anti-sigma factor RsiW